MKKTVKDNPFIEKTNEVVSKLDDCYKQLLRILQDEIIQRIESDELDPNESVVNQNLKRAIENVRDAIWHTENYVCEDVL